MEFLIVLNDLGAVMCLQCSKGETQWAYPHARKDCLRLQKSEKKVDNVSNVTGIKILFLFSLVASPASVHSIPPCTLCKSLSELVLCTHGVFTRWLPSAFGT